MKFGDLMKIHHLITLLIYCNNDVVQRKFSETYRKNRKDESNESVRNRHRNYYFLGRYLRECISCFGTKSNHKCDLLSTVYHGANKQFTFSSISAYINGPFSTTMLYTVAVDFCNNSGVILELDIMSNGRGWSLTDNEGIDAYCTYEWVECAWISDFSNEMEVLFLGGSHKFMINTIIEAPSGINYHRYIKAIRQMTAFTSNDAMQLSNCVDYEAVSTPTEVNEQMILYRLISHRLWSVDYKRKNVFEFKGCPEYIRIILHSHCTTIKSICFPDKKDKVKDEFFRSENEWIDLDVITNMFPNIIEIYYDATNKDLSFLTSASLYKSILSFLSNHSAIKLTLLAIAVDIKYKMEIAKYIRSYEQKFMECGWLIMEYLDEEAVFENRKSIFGRYLPNDLDEVSQQELQTYLINIGTQYNIPKDFLKINTCNEAPFHIYIQRIDDLFSSYNHMQQHCPEMFSDAINYALTEEECCIM